MHTLQNPARPDMDIWGHVAGLWLRGPDPCSQVVNRAEVEAMNAGGVPFYAVNIAVGITLAIPGFQKDLQTGLLHALPQVQI